MVQTIVNVGMQTGDVKVATQQEGFVFASDFPRQGFQKFQFLGHGRQIVDRPRVRGIHVVEAKLIKLYLRYTTFGV